MHTAKEEEEETKKIKVPLQCSVLIAAQTPPR
jgi:hypothetical protein